MKINTGDFGFAVPQGGGRADVPAQAFVTQGLPELGATGLKIAGEAAQARTQDLQFEHAAQHEARQKAEEDLKRVERGKAALAFTELQAGADTLQQGIVDGMKRGEITREKAPDVFRKEFAVLKKQRLADVPAWLQPEAGGHMETYGHQSMVGLSRAIAEHRRDEVIAIAGRTREAQERAAQSGDLFRAQREWKVFVDNILAPEIGQAKAQEAVQSFNERTTFTHLAGRMNAAEMSGDPGNVRGTLKALEDRAYGDLDPDKRRLLVAQGMGALERIRARADAARDRDLAALGRRLDAAQKLSLQGMPQTAEQLAPLVTAAKGTEWEAFAQSLVGTAEFVQKFKALPPAAMEASLLKLEQEVRAKPTPDSKRYLDMGRELYENTKRQVRDDPQAFAYGQGLAPAWRPMDWTAAVDLTKTRQPEFADQLAERYKVGLGMARQYGSPVRLLTREEASDFGRWLGGASTQTKLTLLGALKEAAPSADAYSAMMQQIAPDHPVTAVAGVFVNRQRWVTTERRVFGPNVEKDPREIAAVLVEGDALVNRTRGDKAQDGRPAAHGLFVPPEDELRRVFKEQAGDAFRSDPDGADRAFQAMRAYYVGSAAREGDSYEKSKGVNSDRVKASFRAVIGEAMPWGSGGDVILPLGMEPGVFRDRVRTSFRKAVQANGLPEQLVDRLPALGLQNYGDGSFMVLSGTGPLFGKDGRPIVIGVEDAPRKRFTPRGPQDVPQ